ncbi:MAG: hypothetical protein KC649_07070, partial [Candidatus Omnitrophica bacterium]|nr:hypothetical protein [Candidatus Omnitrophota bacterium]
DYIQDANSITLSSGKKIRLAGISIPDLYGKNPSWIGLDEKTMFTYNTEAKDFIKNLVYITETKKSWFRSKPVKSSRTSRLIYIELEPANSKRKHKSTKRSNEILVYAYVLVPDDGSLSEDIMHYAMLPDAKYKERKIVFINEALLRAGYGFADERFSQSKYDILKKAESDAVTYEAPGKNKKYSSLRIRRNPSDIKNGTEYNVEEVLTGFQFLLENGVRVNLLGLVTPSVRGQNTRFTAPYGNLISVAAKKSLNHLEHLLTDGDSEFRSVSFGMDYRERKRNKKNRGPLTSWVYTKDPDDSMRNINNCCAVRLSAGAATPDWASQQSFNDKLVNLEVVLSGFGFPIDDHKYRFHNLLKDAFAYADAKKAELHSDDFVEMNYISEMTKTAKGKNAPTKRIGTPRRRWGLENNSWDGQSNFNG